MAYNFKNVIIETHMYLERLSIESGGGGAGGSLTPAASSIMDDDQASMISSIRPHNGSSQITEMPPPPPMSVISSSVSAGSPNTKESSSSSSQQANGSLSEVDEFPLMDASQIKQEPEEDCSFVMRSAIQEIMKNHKKRGRPKGGEATATKDVTIRKFTRNSETSSNNNNLLLKKAPTSPCKRPMVAVHKTITRSSQQDKAYLASVLKRKRLSDHKTPNVMKKSDPSWSNAEEGEDEEDETDTESISKDKMENSLVYDLNNSKVIREILENLPKNRLRARRISTPA